MQRMSLYMQVLRIVLKLLEQGFAGSTGPELNGWIAIQRNIRPFDSARKHSECAQQNQQRMQSKTESKAPTRRMPEIASRLGGLKSLAQDLARSSVRAVGRLRPMHESKMMQGSVTATFVCRETRGSRSPFRQ